MTLSADEFYRVDERAGALLDELAELGVDAAVLIFTVNTELGYVQKSGGVGNPMAQEGMVAGVYRQLKRESRPMRPGEYVAEDGPDEIYN